MATRWRDRARAWLNEPPQAWAVVGLGVLAFGPWIVAAAVWWVLLALDTILGTRAP